MLRKIIGFAVLAVVALVAFRLAVGLLGFVWGLAWLLLKLALVGLVVYWVLTLVSPSTARKVREMIGAERPPTSEL